MRNHILIGLLLLALAVGGCATPLSKRPIGTAAPVAELSGQFNNVSRDGKIYFAGQPTEEGIEAMAARGVKVVVNIRPPETMGDVKFDEAATAKKLGMKYVSIPVTPEGLSKAEVDALAAELEGTDGPLLLHCRSSNTAGGLWAAYLASKRGVPLEDAIEKGKAAGLKRDDMIEAARRAGTNP